ncbi:thioredoxin family protein [Diaphorobacter sp. HDW4A]|uniref:thioredoxin family protein n=1 Tax=Diaphorobacter sp. HDW4A TaxID=2714924 RepID=UPI00140C4B15|nr:thioredoxin family protein [Diaphorobacter sp. HDW4A]QIL80757.1 thioredoxin family protein [Diaphorobacter sp. HDW4A]
MGALDPWDDASEIAIRLNRPGAVLMVLIGAEAWCERCRNLRPYFEDIRNQLPQYVVALWMDLEDHAEFLGDYIPESLPELCIYRSKTSIQKSLLDGSPESLLNALQMPTTATKVGQEDPGIFERLVQEDWAA